MPTLENRSRDLTPLKQGLNFFVDATDGSDLNSGLYPGQAVETFEQVVANIEDRIAKGQRVTGLHIEPGDYDENVVIPRSIERLTITGRGGPGSVSVNAVGANADAITVHGRDVRLENINGAGTGTGAGLVVTGRRFSADAWCKLENQDGTGKALVLGPGLVADINAGLADKGDFARFEGTLFAYAAQAVVLQGSDYGASGQNEFMGCRSLGITGAHFAEAHLAGGAASLHYRDLRIKGHSFEFGTDDDGVVINPTRFLDLNDDNGNQGKVEDSSFPVAKAGAQNVVSTLLVGVGNHFTDGDAAF
ncbi:MAG: hypothetical protein LC623_05455 [Halobacteriales archaeon]|nr:hypothetical protein [Halobacteriales archaeon]